MQFYRIDSTHKIDMKFRSPTERKPRLRAIDSLSNEEEEKVSEQGEPFSPFVQGRKELARYRHEFIAKPKPDKKVSPFRFSQWAEGLGVAAVDAHWVEELRQDRALQQELLDFSRGYYLIGDQQAASKEFKYLAFLSQVCPEIQTDPVISQKIRKYYSVNVKSWIDSLDERGPDARVYGYPLLVASMQLLPDQQRVITQAFSNTGKPRFMEEFRRLLKEKEHLVLLMAGQVLLIDPGMRVEIKRAMQPHWPWVNQTLQAGSLPEIFLDTSIIGAERAWVDRAGQIKLEFKPQKTMGRAPTLPERRQM